VCEGKSSSGIFVSASPRGSGTERKQWNQPVTNLRKCRSGALKVPQCSLCGSAFPQKLGQLALNLHEFLALCLKALLLGSQPCGLSLYNLLLMLHLIQQQGRKLIVSDALNGAPVIPQDQVGIDLVDFLSAMRPYCNAPRGSLFR